MIKLFVFDCDGVMFDSKPANRVYYDHLLLHFGKPVMDEDELEYVHTHSVKDCITHIFRNHDISRDEIESFRSSIDYAAFLDHFAIEPDLIEFLEAVQSRYRLAISTNRANTMHLLLDHFNLAQYYEKVMTSANAAKPKPAPDAMEEILDFFGIKAEETIFIGDSIIDQQHAEASGTHLVAFKNRDLKTPYHVNSFMEILKLDLVA